MIIKSATFHISSSSVNGCPTPDKPEFAFIGRSNVGKSSLINMLTGNGKLAMTSATPGKTILINHFLINKKWYLVDLPGYGYAKRSKSKQEEFTKMIANYVVERENLYNLYVLIDGNIPPQQIDLEFIAFLGENEVPFTLVFTKADKSGKTKYRQQVEHFMEKLRETWEELPDHLIVSSAKQQGREELLDHIGNIIKMSEQQ